MAKDWMAKEIVGTATSKPKKLEIIEPFYDTHFGDP